MTMNTSLKKLVVEKSLGLKEMWKFIVTTRKINMIISKQYYMYLLYIYIFTAGEKVVKGKYRCSMEVENNWYCKQHPQQHVITVQTRTIIHSRLEVNAVTNFHAIPKCVCTRTQAKKIHTKTHYMFD